MKHILSLLMVLVTTLILSGCGDSSSSTTPTDQADAMVPAMDETAPEIPLSIASVDACTIDAQCVSGAFCFHGRCAMECQDDGQCFDGERCGARGRCENVSAQVSNGLVVDGNTAGAA
jgi:hypothetical protein